jgi:molybdopterin converting factor small subunit
MLFILRKKLTMPNQNHKITLHLYANLKEKVGTNCLDLTIPTTCTVGELKTRLKGTYPALAAQLNKVAVTINGGQVFISDEVIPHNADVTILPPFGGG